VDPREILGKRRRPQRKYRVVSLIQSDLDALRRDGPPLEEWYSSYAPALFGYAARRVGRELAEDLTAQVFVEALESWSRFDPELGTPRTWLFAIATNLVRTHLRREQRSLDVFARTGVDPLELDPMLSTEGRLDAEGAWPQVADALRRLTPVDREVLLLHCFAELDYAEIGRTLGLPVGTVGSKMNRVRRKLRRRLHDAGRGGT
jgi:RNA polymerase sigma factor (sigma-70 family)